MNKTSEPRLGKYPVKNKDVAHRVLGDVAIMVNFKNSFFYNLNSVGTFIWERCDGQHTLDQIAASLADQYDVEPAEAARDCLEFINGLVEQGVLAWNSGEDR
jgi:hypothetical protein